MSNIRKILLLEAVEWVKLDEKLSNLKKMSDLIEEKCQMLENMSNLMKKCQTWEQIAWL